MALEDEIINIDNLDVSKQIQNGDFILIETADGTKLIDYRDFVIGIDNITFYDKISGLEDTTAAGENLLKSSNIEALSAKDTELQTALAAVSSANNEISNLETRLGSIMNDVNTLKTQVGADISSFTTAKVGFSVSRYQQESNIKSISFTEEVFKGSSLVDFSLREQYGDGLSLKYVAVGTYILQLTGYLTIKSTPSDRAIEDRITINKNGVAIATFAHTATDLSRKDIPETYSVPINTVVKLESGDVITFSMSTLNDGKLQAGNITGATI